MCLGVPGRLLRPGLTMHGGGVEIWDQPAFRRGEKVRARRNVRNDGTFPGAAMGEVLIPQGAEGYVHSVGTWLNRFYVYGVEFVEAGRLVGMRGHEIAPVMEELMKITVRKSGPRYEVYVARKDLEEQVVAMENAALWGGWIELGNGWRFDMPDLPPETPLPLTVEARRIGGGEG